MKASGDAKGGGAKRLEIRKYTGGSATLYVRLLEVTTPASAKARYVVRWELREALPSGTQTQTATAGAYVTEAEGRAAYEAQCAEAKKTWGEAQALTVRTAQFRPVPALPPARQGLDDGPALPSRRGRPPAQTSARRARA